MPVYLTGEMDAHEAAMACQWLGVRYAVPCHHDESELPEIVRFRELLSEGCQADEDAPRTVVLSPGERLILHRGS